MSGTAHPNIVPLSGGSPDPRDQLIILPTPSVQKIDSIPDNVHQSIRLLTNQPCFPATLGLLLAVVERGYLCMSGPFAGICRQFPNGRGESLRDPTIYRSITENLTTCAGTAGGISLLIAARRDVIARFVEPDASRGYEPGKQPGATGRKHKTVPGHMADGRIGARAGRSPGDWKPAGRLVRAHDAAAGGIRPIFRSPMQGGSGWRLCRLVERCPDVAERGATQPALDAVSRDQATGPRRGIPSPDAVVGFR